MGAPGVPAFPSALLHRVLARNNSVRVIAAVADAAPMLAAGDAYVSNSQSKCETWGLSVLGALGAGLPVLSSNDSAAPEMLAEGVTALLHHLGGSSGSEVAMAGEVRT
jgi:glycosyltransferase involved in cell wall biosynthesis